MMPDAMRAWRAQLNMSQADLAREAECSEGLIAQIETRRRQPSPGTALRIAEGLRVKLTAIAFIDEDLMRLREEFSPVEVAS